jgi:hypothetical protein
MSSVDLLAGLACLGFGIYITIIQIKKISKGKQDQLGFDIKFLGGGIMCIMVGVALIISAF